MTSDFRTVTMTEAQVAAIMEKLSCNYRLLIDSVGLFSLYVQIPEGAPADVWEHKFWEAYATLPPDPEGVARPFDADNVNFVSSSDIADDEYLEHLFQKPKAPIEMPAPHLQHWIQPEKLPPRTKRSGKPHRVAFYSYKGGVGRSTTMVLAALTLASQGKNVLLVDFDLEAPGLATMLLDKDKDKMPRWGLVDYLCEWPAIQNLRKTDGNEPGKAESGRELARHRKRIKNDFLSELDMDLPGTVYVLTAGRINYVYPEKLAYASLARIERVPNEENPIEALFSDLAAEIKDLGYIFIDSRTGIADIGGSLLFRYADMVCACFYDDRQNREGMDLLAQYVLRRRPEQRPNVLWVHTKSPAQDPTVHEQLADFLAGVYTREKEQTPPSLYQIVEHEALRRVDRAKFEGMSEEHRERILADLNVLLEAIKREVNDDE